MAKKRMVGRVRYEEETDSFVYELYREDAEDWGLVMRSKCVRREGAKDGEDANYVSWQFMMQVVNDCKMYDVRLV